MSAESLRHPATDAVLNLCTSVKVMRSVPLPMRWASHDQTECGSSPSFWCGDAGAEGAAGHEVAGELGFQVNTVGHHDYAAFFESFDQ